MPMRHLPAALLALVVATPAMAEDLVFTLINDSSVGIVEMYVSPVGEQLWGENILMVDVVPSGTQGDITIADGLDVCDYDLRFVADNGVTAEKTQNLCDMATFTVTD
jgi:hypothetical protein